MLISRYAQWFLTWSLIPALMFKGGSCDQTQTSTDRGRDSLVLSSADWHSADHFSQGNLLSVDANHLAELIMDRADIHRNSLLTQVIKTGTKVLQVSLPHHARFTEPHELRNVAQEIAGSWFGSLPEMCQPLISSSS